jgi:hypothetical protein
MTPIGATASARDSFVLLQNGQLWKHGASGWTYLLANVATVSNQAIDDAGHALVDVVTTTGAAYEYHDGLGWQPLASGVKSARAGDGVSYILLTSGQLWEYHDTAQTWTSITGSVTAIEAGTDQLGVNMVDLVLTNGDAWEHSDSTGWHFLAHTVQAVSAGRGGYSEVLLQNGNAYHYNETTGGLGLLATNVAQISAGTDENGNAMIELVYTSGVAYEYRTATGWTYLGSGVKSISRATAGVAVVLFGTGGVYEHDLAGWHALCGSAQAGA